MSNRTELIEQIQEESKKTDLVFDGKLTEREYRSFLFYNTYTSAAGLLTLAAGLAAIVMLVIYWDKAPALNRALFFLVIGFVFLGIPLLLCLRAKMRALDRKAPDIQYTFLIEGLKSNVGDDAYFIKWRKFYKVCETSCDLLLYLDKTRAVIVPKRTLGDKTDTVKGLIERHVAHRKRVKWKR